MESLAKSLAAALAKELSLSKDDRDIAAYALYGLLSTTFYASVLIALAWALDVLLGALLVAATVAVFRTFMGGAHFSTAWRCGLTGSVVMTGLAFLVRFLQSLPELNQFPVQVFAVSLLGAFALIAISRHCPADVPAKPITDPEQRRRLRRIARLLLAAWYSAALAASWTGQAELLWSLVSGLGLQLLLVTPAGYSYSEQLDKCLNSLLGKED